MQAIIIISLCVLNFALVLFWMSKDVHELHEICKQCSGANAQLTRLLNGYTSITTRMWDVYQAAQNTKESQHLEIKLDIEADGTAHVTFNSNENE